MTPELPIDISTSVPPASPEALPARVVLLGALRGAWAGARTRVRALFARRTVRVAAFAVSGTALMLTAAAHHVYLDHRDVPDLQPFIRFEPPTIGEVQDARGQVLIELAREYRRVVEYPDIPPVVRDAILAAEDKNFFSHSGIDYGAFPRVAWKTLTSSIAASWRHSTSERRLAPAIVFPQGGSTLTQQLVRGYFLRDMTSEEDRGTLIGHGFVPALSARVLGVPATNKLVRKVEEIRLSFWLEREMERRYGSKRRAKEEILARYASFIYMGNGRYGFAAASEYYFGKPLASYTAADADKAALLAGITKSPREYAPGPGNLDRPRRRRDDILALMVRNGTLSPELGRRAQEARIRLFARSKIKTEAPAVVENVFDELRAMRPEGGGVEALVDGRIRVQTTVDNRVQRLVNAALESGLRAYEKRHPTSRGLIQGSVVVLRNGDGAILAEAGGRQVYKDRYTSYSDYNRVIDSRRQPGSVMKPIVYLTAFRHGQALDDEVADEPIAVPLGTNQGVKWIHNYDDQFKGLIPVRQALAESRNAATVRLAERVGIQEVIRTARELGIRTPLQPYITTALGASEVQLLELANAYRALASGLGAEPHVIARVTDAGGAALFQARPATRPLDIDPDALAAIQEGLRGVVRLPSGTAHALADGDFGIPVMGKTGTSSDFRDALFVGSTYGPEGVTAAVRIGYDDNRELGEKETGGRAALPIFRDVVRGMYGEGLVGPAPEFPDEMERRITEYLADAAAAPPDDWAAAPPEPEPALIPVRLMQALAPMALRPPAPVFDPERGDRRRRHDRHTGLPDSR